VTREWLASLPVPASARGAVDAAISAYRPRCPATVLQVTDSRPAFPAVGPADRAPAVTVTRAHQRESARRAAVCARKGGHALTPAQVAVARAWIRHPESVALAALPRHEAQKLRAHMRRMGRSVSSQRGSRLVALYCIVRAFGRRSGDHVVATGLGIGALASLFASDRHASAHVSRHTIRARYHRRDRGMAGTTGDPSRGNCGLLDELESCGLLVVFQPSARTTPTWAKGSGGYPFAVLVVPLVPE